MSPIIENNKLKNSNRERSSSGPTKTATTATQTLKKGQDSSDNYTRQEEARKTKKRRPNKVALNTHLDVSDIL